MGSGGGGLLRSSFARIRARSVALHLTYPSYNGMDHSYLDRRVAGVTQSESKESRGGVNKSQGEGRILDGCLHNLLAFGVFFFLFSFLILFLGENVKQDPWITVRNASSQKGKVEEMRCFRGGIEARIFG